MKAFQDQYGNSIPPKELPAQSYFEPLEEMVQDRVFYAESLTQMVSLDTESKHRLANPDTHSQHMAMLFDGSTIRPKRRLVYTMPEDLEAFRAKVRDHRQRLADDETPLTRACSTCRADGRHLGLTQEMTHGPQEVCHGTRSGTTSHVSTRPIKSTGCSTGCNSSCNQEFKGPFLHQLHRQVHPRQLSPTASPQTSKRSRANLTSLHPR